MLSTLLSKDSKTWVHIVLTLVAAVIGVAAVRPLTSLVLVQDGAGVLSAIGVYIATNTSGGFWKYLKGYLSAAGAGLSALATILASTSTHSLGTVTPANWLIVGLQVLAALGVITVGELADFDPAAVIVGEATTGEVSTVASVPVLAAAQTTAAASTEPTIEPAYPAAS